MGHFLPRPGNFRRKARVSGVNDMQVHEAIRLHLLLFLILTLGRHLPMISDQKSVFCMVSPKICRFTKYKAVFSLKHLTAAAFSVIIQRIAAM